MSKISGIVALGMIGLIVMSAMAVGAYAASDQAETAAYNGECNGDCDRDGSCGQCDSDCDGTPDRIQQRAHDCLGDTL